MVARLLASISIATVVALPAFAADTATKSSDSESQKSATQSTQNLPAQIRAKLEQDGFTNVSIVTVVALPAFAADTTTKSNGPESQSSATQPTQNLPAQIRAKLEQDGFTNVSIVPGSFLVSAKDKNGDPVTMVIGPNSMMMLTQVPASNSSTTGSGSTSETPSSDHTGQK